MRKDETLEQWHARVKADDEAQRRTELCIARIGIITDQVREMIAVRRENYRTQPGGIDAPAHHCSRCAVLERENRELRAIIHAGNQARQLLKESRAKARVRSE